MTYKNTTTGFVFNSPCEIKAEGWVALSPAPTLEEKKEEKVVKPVKTKRTKKDD